METLVVVDGIIQVVVAVVDSEGRMMVPLLFILTSFSSQVLLKFEVQVC